MNNKTVKSAIAVVSVIGIMMMTLTLLRVSYYSVMVSDDFWYALDSGIKNSSLWENIVLSCKYAQWVYMTHQGTYFSEFLASILNPVTHGGFPLLRVLMIVNALLMFVTIIWLVNTVLTDMADMELHTRLLIIACVVFAITQYDAFAEVYFWWVGACCYTFPLGIGLIAVTAFVLANRSNDNTRKWVIISCVCGFVSVGGSLTISGTICYLLLNLLIYYWIRDSKLSKNNIIMFSASFVGALINAIAPGNYVRRATEGETDIIRSIKETFEVFGGNIEWLLSNKRTNFLAIVILLMVCGFIFGDRIKLSKKAWYVSSIIALFSPLAVILPVVVGYNVPWLPSRSVYVVLIAFVFAFGNFSILLASLLSQVIRSDKSRNLVMVVGIALFVLTVLTSGFSPRKYIFVRHNVQLYRHEIQDSYHETRELFDSFNEHQGEDMECDVTTIPDKIDNYYCFFLQGDTGERINQAIASLYGLNSIRTTRDFGE